MLKASRESEKLAFSSLYLPLCVLTTGHFVVLRAPGALEDPFQSLWGSLWPPLVALWGHGVSVSWEGAPEGCGERGATLL